MGIDADDDNRGPFALVLVFVLVDASVTLVDAEVDVLVTTSLDCHTIWIIGAFTVMDAVVRVGTAW